MLLFFREVKTLKIKRLLFCFVVCLAAAGPQSASATPETGPNDILIEGNVNFGQTFASAYNSSENEIFIVWTSSETDADSSEVYGRRLNPKTGETIGSERIAVSDIGGDGGESSDFTVFSPKVVFNPIQNEYLVVWLGGASRAALDVYAQRVSASGALLGGANTKIGLSALYGDGNVDYFGFVQSRDDALALVYNSDDNQYLAAWIKARKLNEVDLIGESIVVQRLDGASGAEIGADDMQISAAVPAQAESQDGIVSVAAAYNGNLNEYAVSWLQNDFVATNVTDNTFLKGQRLNASTGAETGSDDILIYAAVAVNSSSSFRLHSPAIAYSASSKKYLLAYGESFIASVSAFRATRYDIFGRYLGEDLQVMGNKFPISVEQQVPNTDSSISGIDPQIQTDTNGRFWVSWPGLSFGGVVIFGQEVFLRILDPENEDGNSAKLTIASYDSESNAEVRYSDVVFNSADSEMFASWFSANTSSSYEIRAQRLRAGSDIDGDQVSDADESIDGTLFYDSGSVIESFGSEVCAEWNGFVSFLFQILELRNTSSETITLKVSMRDLAGMTLSSLQFLLPSGIQQDIIANDLIGFNADTFGLICAEVVDGPSDSIDGQLSTYRFTNNLQSYDLAYVAEFAAPRSGRQYLSYNTGQPSANPADAGNFVANWIQIVSSNSGAEEEEGTLFYYDEEGNMVSEVQLSFKAGQRRDIDVHTLGQNKVGLVMWEPKSKDAVFLVRHNRYYYGQAGLVDLKGALSIPAGRGTGERILTVFDTRIKGSALEISNTLDHSVEVTAEVRDRDGNGAALQPPVITLGPKETTSIVLNAYLPNSLGNIRLSADHPSAIIVSMLEYGIEQTGSLLFASVYAPKAPRGSVLRGSYNSFLGQGCIFRVSSLGFAANSRLSITRFDGTKLLDEAPVFFLTAGTAEVDICYFEDQPAYGEVKFETSVIGSVAADIVRSNSEQFITGARREFGSRMK